MGAADRLQEQKDIALASSKKLIEEKGLKLPDNVDLNIANKVGDLNNLIGSEVSSLNLGGLSAVGDLIGGISDSFNDLIGNAIKSVTNLDPSNLLAKVDIGNLVGQLAPPSFAQIGAVSDKFKEQSDEIASVVEEAKTETLEVKPDFTQPIPEKYVDEDGVTTYKDKAVMIADIKSKKIPEETPVRLESTNTYYVPLLDQKGGVSESTLFNANQKKKAEGVPLITPPNAEVKSVINGVPVVQSRAPKPVKPERKEFATTIDIDSTYDLSSKKSALQKAKEDFRNGEAALKQRLIEANVTNSNYFLEDDPAYTSYVSKNEAKIDKLEKEIADLEASGATDDLGDTSEIDAALEGNAELQALEKRNDDAFNAALEDDDSFDTALSGNDSAFDDALNSEPDPSATTTTGGGSTVIKAEERTPAQKAAEEKSIRDSAVSTAKKTKYTKEKRALAGARRIKEKYKVTLKVYKDGDKWRLS